MERERFFHPKIRLFTQTSATIFSFLRRESPFLPLVSVVNFIEKDYMRSPIHTARKLRQKMTLVEKVLWDHLRNRQFKKWKFRRQHPIVYEIVERRKRFYVADFYCAAKKFIIELDGKYHDFSDQKLYDQARDKILNEMGMQILRIENANFFPLNQTLERIEAALASP